MFFKISQNSMENTSWVVSLNKVSGLRSTSLLKWDYSTGVFLWILLNFEEHLFWRISAASARYPLPIHWRSFSSDLSH